MKNFIFCVLLFLFHATIFAQPSKLLNSGEIYNRLQKLKVLGSVLYIAAHPDDENTKLLTYFSNEKKYRTAYLSLTRGDGGQNLLGNEQGIELGLIRTQELLAARRIDGSEQFFSRAYDFGFSKTMNETLHFWEHDTILSDVVWLIRKFQPDIIITRFPADERAGHGHHQTSSLLAQQAFLAAADSTQFTEQFQYGVRPWKATRIVWNTYQFGSMKTINDTQFVTNIGLYNAILGRSYGEIAAQSRSQHKSQGFGMAAQRGEAFEYFTLWNGLPFKNDLMNNVVTTWKRLSGGEAIEQKIDTIIAQYEWQHPEKSLAALIALKKNIEQLPDSYWKNQKLKELLLIVQSCAGLFMEATSASAYAVIGKEATINFSVIMQNKANINLLKVHINHYDTSLSTTLPFNKIIHFQKTFSVSFTQKPSQPYWLQKPIVGKGYFNVSEQLQIGEAESAPAYEATFYVNIEGENFEFSQPVVYKHTDAVKGELYEPFITVMPFSVSISPHIVLTHVQANNEKLLLPQTSLNVQSFINATSLPLHVMLQLNMHQIAVYDTVINVEANEQFSLPVSLQKINNNLSANTDVVKATIQTVLNGTPITISTNLKTIQYEHIPSIHYFYQDSLLLVNKNIQVKGKKIGYIEGAGDKVAEALQQMGYEIYQLNEKNITLQNLKQFDAIISGVRAYNIHKWLPEKYAILMQYVYEGGNYIVQYNQTENLPQKIGPYYFMISRNRITDEQATVSFLLPQSSVMQYPNKLSSSDFKGWVQERSIYEATNFDSLHYQTPFAMHDAGEPFTKGSLLIAPYGKGNFVYTGLVFFRQLPAGVAGAFRLMANLIALPAHE